MNGGGRIMAKYGAGNTSEGLKPLAVYHLVSCTGRGFQRDLETLVGGGGETQQHEGTSFACSLLSLKSTLIPGGCGRKMPLAISVNRG